MKKLFTLFIIICCAVLLKESRLVAQDMHFSQFYMSPLTQNPAFAGAIYGIEAQVNYKNQWRSVGSPYKTTAASYDMSFQKKKRAKAFFGAGLNFFSDKAGDSKMGTTQVNLSGAGHVYLDRYTKIGGGLQVGFVQRSVDYTQLQWGNQFTGMAYDQNLSSRETNTGAISIKYPDVAAGMVFSYDNTAGAKRVADNNELKANVGLAIFHISQPKYSFNGSDEKLYAKFVLHGNVLISVPYSNLGFVPGLMICKQGGPSEIFAGSLVRYKLKQKSKYTSIKTSSAISGGAYYRAMDAIVAVMQMEYSNYTIGMSYDINVSHLKTASVGRGGFEISIRYIANNPFIVQSRSRF